MKQPLGLDEAFPDKLATHLRSIHDDIALTPGMRTAAVIAAIYPVEDKLFIPLIERASGQGVHSGQLALPGGAWEPGDASLADTALREATEEVALAPSSVRLLGRLPVVSVRVSGFDAVPFVGWLSEEPVLNPNPAEVASVICFPVEALIDPTSLVQVPNPPGSLHPTMYEITFETHRVWGATARMLANLSVALNAAVRHGKSEL